MYTCHTYELKNGKTVEEYVQATPWSSGPVIFLALRDVKTKLPIMATLWSEKRIQDTL